MIYDQIKLVPVKTGDKVIDKGFDDIRRALGQIYRVLSVNGDTLIIPGNIKCKKLTVDSNSLIVGKTKLSEPNGSEDDYLLYYDHKSKAFKLIEQGSASVGTHASSHENGGSDEINLGGLSGTPNDLTTHMGDTTTHGTTGDIVGTSDSQEITNKKFGGSTNYSEFEADGTLHNSGNATTWDDFSVPLTRDKQGQSSKPDYDFTNLGLLFPQNDATEIVYLTMQMSHKKKMDSDIYLHVHYIQTSATKPTFKCDYKFYNNGDTVPASWTTISTASGNKGVLTYSSGSMSQIGTFPAITPPSPEDVSANIDIRFYRDDNDVSGDVITKYIDFHYEIDTQGSRSEYSK